MTLHFAKYIILSSVLCLAPITTLKADIIDHGMFITDTETGLDWLDVTISLNESYNEVINQLEEGGKYEGYRYATADEFNTLVSNYTGTNVTQSQVRQVIDSKANTDKLIDMLGSTQKPTQGARGYDIYNEYVGFNFSRTLDSVTGITITGYSDDGYSYVGYSIIAKTQDFGTRIWHYSNSNINKYVNRNAKDPEAGSFLVRESIPKN